MRGRPGHGDVVRQVPPRAPGAQHIQAGVEVLAPPLRWAGPSAFGMFRDEEAGDARPRGIRHIGAVLAPPGQVGVTGASMVIRCFDTSSLARVFVGVVCDADR
nr:hypothetical protein [Mycobacterium sp. SM1]